LSQPVSHSARGASILFIQNKCIFTSRNISKAGGSARCSKAAKSGRTTRPANDHRCYYLANTWCRRLDWLESLDAKKYTGKQYQDVYSAGRAIITRSSFSRHALCVSAG